MKSYGFDVGAEPRLFEDAPKVGLSGSAERVHVLADGSFEEERRLRNHGNVLAERVQTHRERIAAAEGEAGADFGFDDAEERLNDRRLPRAGAANDADLLAGRHSEADFPEHERQIGPVTRGETAELERGRFGPRHVRVFVFGGGFDFGGESDLCVVVRSEGFLRFEINDLERSFAADHQTLHGYNLPQKPLHKLTELYQENNSNSIEATINESRLMNANLQTNGHEYHSCKTNVEAEPSGNNIKSNNCLGGIID
jgi:hypothetical protein